jgi:hypothetical protein
LDSHAVGGVELLQTRVLGYVILAEQLSEVQFVWNQGFVLLEMDVEPVDLTLRMAIQEFNHELYAHFIHAQFLLNHLSVLSH